MSKFGRFQVPESPDALARLHFHDPATTLREVDHEPNVGVLDQEDLTTQGIYCSEFIPGVTINPVALGSCTCNTLTEALSRILAEEQWIRALCAAIGQGAAGPASFTDTVGAERGAIGFYHKVTDQTGESSSEWPPTDCGSSGPYLYEYALAQGLIKTEEIAVPGSAESIVSLMQSDGLLVGLPFLNAWMNPGANGIVDGNGSLSTLKAQIREGVAGGHELYFSAIEQLTLDRLDRVVPEKTIVRFRNHWTKSWGDNGSGRFHLSTIVALSTAIDLRQFAA